jgi:hypothetical protein
VDKQLIGLLAVVLLGSSCGAVKLASGSSVTPASLQAGETSVRFLLAPPPSGSVFELRLAQGGAVTAVWRDTCRSGLPVNCLRSVELQTSWPAQRVAQLLTVTGQAGFPNLSPAPTGGTRGTLPTANGWRLEITGVDSQGRGWTGAASGSGSQPDPYLSIWGPGSFPATSSTALPDQTVPVAAEGAISSAFAPPAPDTLIGAQMVVWPNSCLGLPSISPCTAGTVSGWLLTYGASDGSWFWVRTDQSGQRAVVDDGSTPILCGSGGAGCATPPPTCQACPPAPGPSAMAPMMPEAAGRQA